MSSKAGKSSPAPERRRRTPSTMIRPNVLATLNAMADEGVILSRRDIAKRAGISTQTLYNHALDLVEEAEKRWAAHSVTIDSPAPVDKRREARELNAEIERLNRRIDEIAETMEKMLKAVQAYAPNALPQVASVLARHLTDKSK